MISSKITYIIALIAMISTQSYSMTEEDLKAEFAKIVMKCTKEHPVEMSDLLQLQKYVIPKDSKVACLLACAYKTEGTMDAKGMFNLNHAYEVAELMKNGDEQRVINAKKIADVCVKVNELEVSDGEKGCERAVHIFKCAVENVPKYGFRLV